MIIEPTTLSDVFLLKPRRFGDARGWFSETWNRSVLASAGITLDFVQDNHSLSVPMGTLRGLHFQAPPHAQDKLVRCTRGVILDVAVDIRVGSQTYGNWIMAELSEENGHQLLISKGFLHGFLTMTPDTEVQYKCSDYYAPECDGAVLWNTVGINWPLSCEPILSAKDASAVDFADFHSPFKLDEI